MRFDFRERYSKYRGQTKKKTKNKPQNGKSPHISFGTNKTSLNYNRKTVEISWTCHEKTEV